jgi:hypothetical protein
MWDTLDQKSLDLKSCCDAAARARTDWDKIGRSTRFSSTDIIWESQDGFIVPTAPRTIGLTALEYP